MNNPIKKEVLIGGCRLLLGDCLEIMPTLEKVDAVITDPPYEITPTSITHYTKPGMLGGWMGKEYPVNQGKMFEIPEFGVWMSAALDAAKDDADAYFMSNDRNLADMINTSKESGWKVHNILVWQKPMGIPNRWYFKDVEFTVYCWKGKAKTIRHPSSKQTFKTAHTQDRKHPSEKPIKLMSHYIENSTDIGFSVLDPFMGSGTGVACAKLGRKFIGIEMEPKYFDIACKRIEDAYKQPDLFVEPPKKAEQLDIEGTSSS
jgi:DNA modification methylase